MQWWRDARFGLFIHWGPVSLKGTEIGWSRGGERRGTGGTGGIPADVYDNLYKEFNPVKFNADEWVAIAKDAGMKYLVFTTRHHDGFSMFASSLTDYKITNSPFRRDVVKELADACHKEGLRLGFYYSPPDWRHSDYRTDNHVRFVAYLHGQLRELCTNYGQTVYVHMLTDTDDVIALPVLKTSIQRASLIDGTPVEFVSTNRGTVIRLPSKGRDPNDTVVALKLYRAP